MSENLVGLDVGVLTSNPMRTYGYLPPLMLSTHTIVGRVLNACMYMDNRGVIGGYVVT